MRHPAAALVLGALVLAPVPLLAADREAAALAPRTAMEQDRIETLSTDRGSQAPLPIGVEQDVYCSGWIGPLNEKFIGRVASAELKDTKREYSDGDILYIDIGANQGVTPGLEFWVVRPNRVVYKHGSVLDELGRVYETPGRLRVICVQENSAIVEVERACTEIEIGDSIMVFEPIPIPLVKRTRPYTSCDSSSGKQSGYIVDVKDSATPIGTTSVVFIDLGEKDGLVAGDFLSVFRTRNEANGVRTLLGEIAILKVQPTSSVAVVTGMADTMYAGDQVELK